MTDDDPTVPFIEIRNLKTYFPIQRGVFARTVGYVRAVDDVSFAISAGETVGLVGESGCGKTTLGRTLMGLEKATAGEVLLEGNDILGLPEREFRPLRGRLQMIFQDPYSSLNPRLTVREIVTEGIALHRQVETSRDKTAAELLLAVGMDDDSLHRYPHEFSGGQRQRISIARALSLRPDFIVCDEPVSALDVSVQAQVINLLIDLREQYDLSYLFISHDLSVVRLIADRVAVMYVGQIVEYGPAADVIGSPLHPYTQALISAVPVPGRTKPDRIVLQGDLPSPANPPPGCRFHPRCPRAMDICRSSKPAERTVDGRSVCCHLYGDGALDDRSPAESGR